MRWTVLADTHMGHEKIKTYCDRPDDFEDQILRNLDSISSDDYLFHLGDVALYREDYWHRKLLSCLRCPAHLIIGNHDRKSASHYIGLGWAGVSHRLDLHIFGRHIALSHRALPLDDSYGVNVHGHNHMDGIAQPISPRHRLVSLEHHYQPQLLQDIVDRKL